MKLPRIGRVQHRSAADIRADIAKVDKAALAEKVAEVEQERRKLLLSGTDEDLHQNKRDLDAAMLQVERADTLLDELHRLADEAATREAETALHAEHSAAKEAAAAIDKAVADAEIAAAQLRAHLDEVTAAAAIVAGWNSRVGPAPVGELDRRIVYTAPAIVKQRLIGTIR